MMTIGIPTKPLDLTDIYVRIACGRQMWYSMPYDGEHFEKNCRWLVGKNMVKELCRLFPLVAPVKSPRRGHFLLGIEVILAPDPDMFELTLIVAQ